MSTILLVEDDESLIDVYSIMLKHENFTVITARNGEEGLIIAKTQKPDLILLDIMMPKMNGLQALEILKSEEVTKNIPVLILSNIAESNQEENALKLGAQKYIVKSEYLPNELIKIIKDSLPKQ